MITLISSISIHPDPFLEGEGYLYPEFMNSWWTTSCKIPGEPLTSIIMSRVARTERPWDISLAPFATRINGEDYL